MTNLQLSTSQMQLIEDIAIHAEQYTKDIRVSHMYDERIFNLTEISALDFLRNCRQLEDFLCLCFGQFEFRKINFPSEKVYCAQQQANISNWMAELRDLTDDVYDMYDDEVEGEEFDWLEM